MLKRKFYNKLVQWKASHKRECLLVKGARQVGKTFIIDQFGRENYSSYLYIDFLSNPSFHELFEGSLEATEIFKHLTARFPEFKLIPHDTLIFLDEIQRCPMARTAFKQFAIDGRVDVIGSGSLLGITFFEGERELNRERREASIPVGYERQEMMYSMDFEEYLWALGYRDDAVAILKEAFDSASPLPTSVNDRFEQLFREYLVIGGMPEAVSRFTATNSFSEAHAVHEQIIASNLDDISRYALTYEKPKVRACYLSLPEQLARENRKFMYSAVEHGGTARRFGSSIDWLRESSLALQCFNLAEPAIPLRVNKKHDAFKLYLSDIGILTAMMGYDVKKPVLDNTLKGFAKGGLFENAIMSALVRRGYEPYYYQAKPSAGEIDFLIERDGSVVPIEVKAGRNPSASFDRLLASSDVSIGYKFTSGNLGRVGKKITLPHYMAMFV